MRFCRYCGSTEIERVYAGKKQPCIRFLKAVRILDPSQLPAVEVSCYTVLKADLRLPDTCDEEWLVYLRLVGDISTSFTNPLQFWKAVQNRVPNLAARAVLLLQFNVHSGDVERSFSAFNQVFTSLRQRLTPENTAGLLRLYLNKV